MVSELAICGRFVLGLGLTWPFSAGVNAADVADWCCVGVVVYAGIDVAVGCGVGVVVGVVVGRCRWCRCWSHVA